MVALASALRWRCGCRSPLIPWRRAGSVSRYNTTFGTPSSAAKSSVSERSRHSNLQLFNPHLPLRLSEKREIGDFAKGNVTVNFQGLFSLFNHYAQSFFADAWILVVDLGHAFVGGRGDFSIDLQPLHYELDGPVTIAPNKAVGLDARLDHALDFIGLLLDFLYTGY